MKPAGVFRECRKLFREKDDLGFSVQGIQGFVSGKYRASKCFSRILHARLMYKPRHRDSQGGFGALQSTLWCWAGGQSILQPFPSSAPIPYTAWISARKQSSFSLPSSASCLMQEGSSHARVGARTVERLDMSGLCWTRSAVTSSWWSCRRRCSSSDKRFGLWKPSHRQSIYRPYACFRFPGETLRRRTCTGAECQSTTARVVQVGDGCLAQSYQQL